MKIKLNKKRTILNEIKDEWINSNLKSRTYCKKRTNIQKETNKKVTFQVKTKPASESNSKRVRVSNQLTMKEK